MDFVPPHANLQRKCKNPITLIVVNLLSLQTLRCYFAKFPKLFTQRKLFDVVNRNKIARVFSVIGVDYLTRFINQKICVDHICWTIVFYFFLKQLIALSFMLNSLTNNCRIKLNSVFALSSS